LATPQKLDRERDRKLRAQKKFEKRKRKRELQRERVEFIESRLTENGQVGAVEKLPELAP